MNGYEFAMFLKTPEGEKRKTEFARLEAMDDEENINDTSLRSWRRTRQG